MNAIFLPAKIKLSAKEIKKPLFLNHFPLFPLFSRVPVARLTPRRQWALAIVSSMVFLAAGCGKTPQEAEKKPKVDVTIPITGTVTDYEDFTGRLDALKTTDIRAHVSGYILKAPFKEGDEVNKDAVLFEIDPRTFEADYNQADANLKLAIADSKLQEKNAKRASTIVRSRAMSEEDYETAMATAEKARATVKATEAAKNRAKVYLDYTKVTAPWSGRISRRLVDPGNLVNADNTVLTTLVTEDPLYAYFDVNERTYLELVSSSNGRQVLGFPVLMRLANEADFTRPGIIDFVDNRVNATTGTIRMRGVFPNEAKILKPGLFVRIRLPIGTPYQALMIPDEAVLSDQGRKYVFVVENIVDVLDDVGNVVGHEGKVVYRSVDLGQELQGLRVIKKGLAHGERVIITGSQRVRAGNEVGVNEKAPPKPPESRLSQLLASIKPGKNNNEKPADNNGQPASKEAKKPADKEAANQSSGSVGSGN
jgi:membrane fusion protein, multidrug efflux system